MVTSTVAGVLFKYVATKHVIKHVVTMETTEEAVTIIIVASKLLKNIIKIKMEVSSSFGTIKWLVVKWLMLSSSLFPKHIILLTFMFVH